MLEKPPRPAGHSIPVARPAQVPVPLAIEAVEEEAPEPESWFSFTRASLRGWSTSMTLHGTLLLVLGLWIIVPHSNPPKVFSTRLAGSENGVEEGLTSTGGL